MILELILYWGFFIVGFLGGRINREYEKPGEREELEEKIKYYKDLCIWHVENNDKQKRQIQMLEDECKAMRDQL